MNTYNNGLDALAGIVRVAKTEITGDAGTGGAPSLPLAPAPEKPYVDQGPPLPEKFKKQLAKEMAASPSNKAGQEPTKKSNFLTANTPGLNIPVWQTALGAIGVLAISVGIVSLVRNPSRGPVR